MVEKASTEDLTKTLANLILSHLDSKGSIDNTDVFAA